MKKTPAISAWKRAKSNDEKTRVFTLRCCMLQKQVVCVSFVEMRDFNKFTLTLQKVNVNFQLQYFAELITAQNWKMTIKKGH